MSSDNLQNYTYKYLLTLFIVISSIINMKRTVAYILKDEEEKAIIDYLKGEINSRELGSALKISHQQALNMLGGVCRQWVQLGKLQFGE